MTLRTRDIVLLCARQELRISVRSRWTQTFVGVFGGLAVAVALSGYVLSGGSGMQDFARTAASLIQLVLLLVPLTSLVLGVMSLTPEPGAAELLYSQPVERRTILAGKLLGLFAALTASQVIGFGAAGLVVFSRTGSEGVGAFIGVVAGSVAVTVVFLALAAAIAGGDTSARRARALAVSLIAWFIAVVLFDIVALGIASMLPSGIASRVLMTAAIANPVDAIRTATLLMVNGTTAFGGASLAFLRFVGGSHGALLWPIASIAVWTVALLVVASTRLRNADI